MCVAGGGYRDDVGQQALHLFEGSFVVAVEDVVDLLAGRGEERFGPGPRLGRQA
jgi:hypothetical protein